MSDFANTDLQTDETGQRFKQWTDKLPNGTPVLITAYAAPRCEMVYERLPEDDGQEDS